MKINIRGAGGLGDAIYLYIVANYYKKKGYDVTLRTRYPEMYKQIGINTEKFYKIPKADITAGYSNRKEILKTNQYQDILINSNIPIDEPFIIDWKIQDERKIRQLKERVGKKKILFISMPHKVFGRDDGYGREMLPDFKKMQTALLHIKRKGYYVIQVGKGECLYTLNGIDEDLQGNTTIPYLMDIASISDGFLGQIGYVVPFAEAFQKPLMALFAKKALTHGDKYTKTITGDKILSQPLSRYVYDDCKDIEMINKIDEVFN